MTEHDYEMAVIQLLEGEGWNYLPPALQPERDYRNPLLVEKLEASILSLPCNRGLPREAVFDAIRKLGEIDAQGLVERNRQFTDYLQNGVPTTYVTWTREKGEDYPEEHHVLVQLIDSAQPEANDFTVTNQWTVEGKAVKRPDVVLFVNGLPLVVIELKGPSREETDEEDAFAQIKTYQRVVEELFVYNAFVVTSDMTVTKAGTITSGADRFMQWKSVDGVYEESEIARFETLFKGLLAPKRLIDVVKNFLCFSVEGKGSVKVLAGYHQYFAVRKAVAKTQKACGYDGRGGVFWHTQGSGKSLSMVFYAKLLQEALGSPTLVVLTDRNDLDEQLFGQFAKCADFLRQKPVMAKSRKDLRNLLENRKANGIFFSTIQKFEESDEPLTDRSDVIVMADEAHRSHYGLVERMKMKRNENGDLVAKRQVGCARIIRSSLPKATYIAFTGTPVETNDRSTREVFGDYIDIYDMTQSVLDGATRPLYYESLVAKLELNEDALALIDGEYDKLAKEERANAVTIERSKRELAQLETLLGHEQTIALLVKDIVDHYESCRKDLLTGKAMIVAYSREIAVKIYREMLRVRPEWATKVKVVMTETLRRNRTIDWQRQESARARMRLMVKKLLQKYKYPPDEAKEALDGVLSQCELWADNSCFHRLP